MSKFLSHPRLDRQRSDPMTTPSPWRNPRPKPEDAKEGQHLRRRHARHLKCMSGRYASLSAAYLDHERSSLRTAPSPQKNPRPKPEEAREGSHLSRKHKARAGETHQTEGHKAEGDRRVAQATHGSQAARENRGIEGEGGKDRGSSTSEIFQTHRPNTTQNTETHESPKPKQHTTVKT
jgi:hypothetical protein